MGLTCYLHMIVLPLSLKVCVWRLCAPASQMSALCVNMYVAAQTVPEEEGLNSW